MNWYNENIEPEIRDLVRHLRNKGINTECSCGHEMHIQCQYIPDGFFKYVHDSIYNYLCDGNQPVSFEINIKHNVIDGHCYTSMDIRFPKELGNETM